MSPSPNTEWSDPLGLINKPTKSDTGWVDELGILKYAGDTPEKFMADATATSNRLEQELQEAIRTGSSLGGKVAAPGSTTPFKSRFEELRRAAVERPDIAAPGEKPFTFAGRVVTKPGEKPEETLKRLPMGEMEAGSLAATAPMDVAAMAGMGKLAAVAGAHPKQSVAAITEFIKNAPGRWRGFWQNIGENITSKVPTYFRAGRGTPLEFREARFQMESDIANRVEQAVSLGRNLKKDLSIAERARADQLLRGSITTGKTDPKLVAAVEPVRKAINEIQDELIKLGRLSPETVERFQENFGPYLARLYTSKEFTTKNPVFPFPKPVRAGTERLQPRGERVEVEIPSLEKEMQAVSRMVGPESEFRREFRKRAGELARRKETVETTSERTQTIGERRQTETSFKTEGGEGGFTKVPLSGVAKKLEDMVEGALVARGMTASEAQAAIGRVKSAAVKTAQAGPEVEITAGGGTKETTRETITRETQTTRETVRKVIENLGINKGQQAALHAYYDAISRAGAKAKSIRVGDKTYKIAPIMDPNSAAERVEALDPLLRAGFKVEKRSGNRVTLFRDIPEGVRKQMGEIRTDPGYVAGRSIAQAGREVAVTRFFKTVADNPEWASSQRTADWVRMSTDKKRLADLAGKWVRPDIAAEINDAVMMKADWEKILARTTSLWKIGKVTTPNTMMRNFYTSGLMADWGGLSPYKPSGIRSYHTTIQAIRGKNPAAVQYWDEAKKAGLFNAAYNQAELNALATGYSQSREANPILRMLDGIKTAVDKTGIGTAYGSIDNFYKAALFTHGRKELGMSIPEAARYSKKYAIDYSDVSPFVRLMREVPLGSPFITFASKAIPLAIETAVKNPVRFWKWPAIIYGLNELSYRSFGAEREQVEKVGDLAKLRSPRYLLLPGKAADGRYRFLDLGYILPFGDLLEAYDQFMGGAGDANISFMPLGGVIQPFVEVAFNKSLFTKKPIYNETDTYPEMAAKISDHFGKSLLSPLAPPIPFTGFRGGYSTEAFRKAIDPTAQLIGEAPMPASDFFGRTRTLGATAASKLLGIDIKNVSIQDVQKAGFLELQKTLDELGRETARIARTSISQRQKEQELLNLTEKYKALGAEVRKKFGLGPEKPNERKALEGEWNDSLGILK